MDLIYRTQLLIKKPFNVDSLYIFVMLIVSIFLVIQPFATVQAANGEKEQITSEQSRTQSITKENLSSPRQEKLTSSEQRGSTQPKDKKLHVTSDSMLVEKESSTITFSGNVVATQGDSVIRSDTISVLLFTDQEKKILPANTKQDIKSMTASGNVKFTSKNRTAFADQAVYTAADQKIILTGDAPRVVTGESYVTGKKIILFQESGKVVVEGGKEQRVEALFNSKEEFKQDN